MKEARSAFKILVNHVERDQKFEIVIEKWVLQKLVVIMWTGW